MMLDLWKFKQKGRKIRFQTWQKSLKGKFSSSERSIRYIFNKFDSDKNGELDLQEFKVAMKELGLDMNRKELVAMLSQFDEDQDMVLTFEEFRSAVYTWTKASSNPNAREIQMMTNTPRVNQDKQKNVNGPAYDKEEPLAKRDSIKNLEHLFTLSNHSADESDSEEEEEEEFLEFSDRVLFWWACWYLFVGVALVTIFSDPMCNTLSAFANTTSIPAFYVSFVVTPLASNAAEVLAAVLFAKKKTTECVTLSVASLYGAACMNSTFCLAIFFALIYLQELTWTFTAETCAIL
eukprot:UN30162